MNIKKRQEIVNLMPWYNLGKLSEAETLMVDEALAADALLREQLELDKTLKSKVIADPDLLNKSAFEPSDVRLNNVLSQIDDSVISKIADKVEPVKQKYQQESPAVLSRVKLFFNDLLMGNSHSFTYAVFAALATVQLSLFLVVPMVLQTSDFATSNENSRNASQEESASISDSELVLVIAIEDNMAIEDFKSKQLGDVKLELLPGSYAYYRIRLNENLNLSKKEIEGLRNELSQRYAKVKFVNEIIHSQ